MASKPNPGAADVARLKTLDEVHAALLGMYPVLVRHIETSSKEEKAAEEKKLAELQDQIQAGLATVSEGDPAGQVEGRAALAEIRSLQASILKLSETDSSNRSATLSLGEAKAAMDECVTRIADLDKLLAAEATTGRDRSAAAYTTGLAWILGGTLAGLLFGGVVATLVTRSVTRPVQEVRNLTRAMADGDLRQRIPLRQQDEVGQLSEATNALADAFSRIVTEIQKVSEGMAGSAGQLSGVSNQLVSQSEHASMKASSVASASEQLTSNISTMASAAEEMSVSVASISSASEEMSINVGTISSAAEQTSTNVSVVSGAVGEISELVRRRAEGRPRGLEHRRRGEPDGRLGLRDHPAPEPVRRGDQQGHRDDQDDRPADQPAGAQRHDRGHLGRRGGPGLRRRRPRDQGTGQPERQGGRGHRAQDRGRPGRHAQGRPGDPERVANHQGHQRLVR